MIIMSINPQKQKTVMMSLPRDMKVNLSGYSEYSPAKINAAYTYGGTKESIDTVQKYLKVPIDYYVLVNMGGLKKSYQPSWRSYCSFTTYFYIFRRPFC